jgi:hypothetical protein
MTHLGARGPRAFAVRCLGALDQTTGGRPLLEPRQALHLGDCGKQDEAEDVAEAWPRWPQGQGRGILGWGGGEEGEVAVAPPLGRGPEEGEIDLHAGLPRRIGQAFRHPVTGGCVGKLWVST